MKCRAVVIEVHQENVLRNFLAARCIYGGAGYERKKIKGMGKILRVLPNWRDEYLEYGGVEYVLVAMYGYIIASGTISRAMGYSTTFVEDPTYSLYQFDCVEIKRHRIPYSGQEHYVNWDPEKDEIIK